MTRPLVGIAASHHLAEDTYEVQMTGRRTIDAVGQVADCLPMLIPGLPDAVDIGDLLGTLDGIVLTGARANVHPRHYGEELTEAHGLMDEGRDAVILPLVRAAIERGVPLLGLCKGIQEMNVASAARSGRRSATCPAGTATACPRAARTPRSSSSCASASACAPAARSPASSAPTSIVTNSLHGQAIRELGRGVVVEGWAADDTIEAISVEGARSFAIGVQWHAEYDAAQRSGQPGAVPRLRRRGARARQARAAGRLSLVDALTWRNAAAGRSARIRSAKQGMQEVEARSSDASRSSLGATALIVARRRRGLGPGCRARPGTGRGAGASSCHVVAPEQAGGDAGPAFDEVANREGQTLGGIDGVAVRAAPADARPEALAGRVPRPRRLHHVAPQG